MKVKINNIKNILLDLHFYYDYFGFIKVILSNNKSEFWLLINNNRINFMNYSIYIFIKKI